MVINVERNEFDWEEYEKELKYRVNGSYKDFYERVKGVGLDDYIYISGLKESKYSETLTYIVNSTLDAYEQLEVYLEEDAKIEFGEKCCKWLPVGSTTNGDFILCSGNEVMILDEGFEEREIYDCSLYEFILKYIKDDLYYDLVTDDSFVERIKNIVILE